MRTEDASRPAGRLTEADAVRRRAAAVVRASGARRPPFFPERYAARCGVSAIVAAPLDEGSVRVDPRADDTGRAHRTVVVVDRRLPPHTPQWNGAVAAGLGETLVPRGAVGDIRRALIEDAAAELLLPMTVFRPAAARTDLTIDGLRDLAGRFAAPLRLTARQWLASGLWHGFALLWREEAGALRLWWRAASSGAPVAPPLGADAAELWTPASRLFATHRTGRPHHGVEEVRSAAGTAWWFVRFGAVRDPGDAAGRTPAGARSGLARAVFAMVMLARGGARPAPRRMARRPAREPEGIVTGS